MFLSFTGAAWSLDTLSPNTAQPLLWTPWLAPAEPASEGLHLNPVQVFASYNAQEPFTGWGDGALWQGAGFNTALQAGVRSSGPFWDINLQPLVWTSANEGFRIPSPSSTILVNSNPPYGDAHRGTWDHPLRQGDQPLLRFDGGQSRAKLFWGPAYVAVGTANRIWGSSRFNAILLSANGPGIPSLELGADPWPTPVGTFEAHLSYGQLKASGYQVDNGRGGTRLNSGLFLGYSPPFLPELSLGAARTINSYWNGFKPLDLAMPFGINTDIGVDKFDQRISLLYRYRVEQAGLELYGEWSRNDFNHTLAWYLNQLEHSHNWVLGIRKNLELNQWGVLRAEAELGVLSLGLENFIHPSGYSPNGADIYTHGIITEGYTIEGQDLGAAAGNGNFLMLDFTWLKDDWSVGQRVVRWVKDYSLLVATQNAIGTFWTDVSFLLDTTVEYRLNAWKLSGSVGTNIEMNRFFDVAGGNYDSPPLWQSWHASAQVAYQF